MSEPAKIKWTCLYCNKPQETTDLPEFDGLKPYAEVLKNAAKNGLTSCNDCFRRICRAIQKNW